MSDITHPRLLYAKGLLFVVCGVMAAALLWLEAPTLRAAILLVIAAWSFARAYFFAFYVIEHYVDPGFRFAGLSSFARYLLDRSRGQVTSPE